MPDLFHALLLGGYSFLVLLAIVLLAITLFDRSQNPEQPSRGRVISLLVLTALVLALLDGLKGGNSLPDRGFARSGMDPC